MAQVAAVSAMGHLRGYLTEYMAENDMTIRELAQKSGVTPNTVSGWINGKYGITLDSLECVKRTLGCTWNQLLGR